MICDTRIAPNIENSVKEEWGGQVLFSSYNSQSRGIALFMKRDLPIRILDKFKDREGNILAVLLEFEEKKILLQGVYGPNNDFPQFFEDEVFNRIDTWNPYHSILVGDWNVALDPKMDTQNYKTFCNPLARLEILKKIDEHTLIDIFRELNPTSKKFTWKQWGSHKFARLDFFLITDS